MLAIIIGTHGYFARELLSTAEMIFGSSSNVKSIHLIPGKGVEDLVKEYEAALEELDTKDGVIFLNDLFGGSPYNAACRIAMQSDGYGVVAGVNLPMLIEMLSIQSNTEGISIVELTEKAIEAGKMGLNNFHRTLLKDSGEDEL
jgi:PTS system, mannose/fructose/sorbose family, IIA component